MADDTKKPAPRIEELIRALNALGGFSERMLREDDARRSRLAVDLDDQSRTDPNRLTPKERYLRDPVFCSLVDLLRNGIRSASYTPTEIREAAMLACIIESELAPARPIFLDPSDPLFAGNAIIRCSKCHRSDCWADANGSTQCQNCGTFRKG